MKKHTSNKSRLTNSSQGFEMNKTANHSWLNLLLLKQLWMWFDSKISPIDGWTMCTYMGDTLSNK